MSWIFIDTHERGVMRLAMLPMRGRIRSLRRKVAPGASIATLATFVAPKNVERASGICVVAGPGSFSAVRSGVLAANLLARVYGKPLYGFSCHETADLRVVRDRLAAGSVAVVPYVAPVYDAEPNITC
ncbi:MAG TPA: hypothetical protein VN397_03080 [Candidatus Methylomirabilis sp.]|nr:hypothetical protein [Candidatus Methylomirabilis sp.]